jgi:2-polyprenyl-6-methoxyphenol hydroxylase-like FAD-dependent oxidoreductase
MLPTQGQGASQSIEDAEALGAYFSDLTEGPVSREDVEARLKSVFEARYERASLIQAYSRQQARPATEVGSNVITMSVSDSTSGEVTGSDLLAPIFTGTLESSWSTTVGTPEQRSGLPKRKRRRKPEIME